MEKSTRLICPSPLRFFNSTALKVGDNVFLYQNAAMEKSTKFTLQSPFKSPFNGHFSEPPANATFFVPTANPTASPNGLISPSTDDFDLVECRPRSRTDVSKLNRYTPSLSAFLFIKNSCAEFTLITMSDD